MSVYPNTGCHAVLALLSEGYPPLKGRSPTRYSPVCHSTHPLRDFRVRLACVRHAASVDSEPGSNSQVKFVCPRTEACAGRQLVQPDSLLNWLSDSIPPSLSLALELRRGRSSMGGPSAALANAPASHPLILDGLCLHVLSSFQRTGCVPEAPLPATSDFLRDLIRSKANLSNLPRRPNPCQAFFWLTRCDPMAQRAPEGRSSSAIGPLLFPVRVADLPCGSQVSDPGPSIYLYRACTSSTAITSSSGGPCRGRTWRSLSVSLRGASSHSWGRPDEAWTRRPEWALARAARNRRTRRRRRRASQGRMLRARRKRCANVAHKDGASTNRVCRV